MVVPRSVIDFDLDFFEPPQPNTSPLAQVRAPSILGYSFSGYAGGSLPFMYDLNLDSITASKITAGEISAQMIVVSGGSILVGTDPGQHVRIDSTGLEATNASDVALVEMRTSGSPVFRLRSGTTGDRVEFTDTGLLKMVRGSTGRDAWDATLAGFNMYPPTGLTFENFAAVDWFRDNQGDVTPFGRVAATWTATQKNLYAIADELDGVHQSHLSLHNFISVAFPVASFGNVESTVAVYDARGANGASIALDSNSGTSTKGKLVVYEDAQSPGSHRLLLSGNVLLEDTLLFGSGATVNLFRAADDVLGTDDEVRSIRATSTDPAFTVRVTGDTDNRVEVRPRGLRFGPGNAAHDLELRRLNPGILSIQDALGSVVALELDLSTDTPTTPSSNAVHLYLRNGNFILAYNDAGTVRYKYLDLTGTGVTWVHTTTAP